MVPGGWTLLQWWPLTCPPVGLVVLRGLLEQIKDIKLCGQKKRKREELDILKDIVQIYQLT